MSVTTDLYVRHSLPLVQAREAMAASKVKVRGSGKGHMLCLGHLLVSV